MILDEGEGEVMHLPAAMHGYEIHSVKCNVPVQVSTQVVTTGFDSERYELRVDGDWVTVRAREALNATDPSRVYAVPLSNVTFVRRS